MKWLSFFFLTWILVCLFRAPEMRRFSPDADFVKMGRQAGEKFMDDCTWLWNGARNSIKSWTDKPESREHTGYFLQPSSRHLSAEEHELLDGLELLYQIERRIDHCEDQWLETKWQDEKLERLEEKLKLARLRNQNGNWLAREFSQTEHIGFSRSQQNLHDAQFAANRDDSLLIRLIRECRQGIRKRKALIRQELDQEAIDYLEPYYGKPREIL